MARSPKEDESPSRSSVELGQLWQITRGYLVLSVVGVAGLIGLTLLLDCHSAEAAPFCADGDMLATIAQVIPATVVAIFVFALGTTFVMAQIVVPSRGSRSIGELFKYSRVQAVLVGGLILLGGSLVITLGTRGTGGTKDPTPWSLALATVLVAATVLYLLAATCLIVWTFVDQLSPRRFKDRLTDPPPISPMGWRRGWTSEELYRVLRVLRRWLRTVNRVGESRDLQFAVEGGEGPHHALPPVPPADELSGGKAIREDADGPLTLWVGALLGAGPRSLWLE